MTSDSNNLTDMRIVKTELFDNDVMNFLSNHDGLSIQQKTQLRKYKKNRVDLNTVQVIYNWGKDWTHHQIGRLSGAGLQGFDREIRSALASKYYFDLDMVNSQPVILTQMCKNNGWMCPMLDDYVLTRQEKMDALMGEMNISKAESKELFIQTLFGSKVGWVLQHPYLIGLTKEMTIIMKNICLKYPAILAHIKKLKKPNPEATCLATIIQDEERKILTIIDNTLTSAGRQMDVLIHDGGLVRKLPNETEFPTNIIRSCEDAVSNKTGYSISLQIKPLIQTIQFSGKAKKYVPNDVLISDSWAGEKLVSLIGDAMLYDRTSGRWIFDFKTGLWSQDIQVLRNYLNMYKTSMIFYQAGSAGDIVFDYSGKESNIKNMFCNIDRHLEPVDFLATKGDSAIGKFLFEDGIYDMKTQTFTPGFNPAIFFFSRIPRPYAVKDTDACKKIHKLLFEDPYVSGEQDIQSQWFERGIARALFGDYERHKNCYITVGQPNCGRGLLTGALMEAFGDYVTVFNPNALVFNPASSSDEAKKMAWAIPLVNSRLAIGNEITMAPKKFIDGNQLKSLAGGGDIIKARLNFKDDAKFVIRTTILLQTNDIPPIKPADEAVMNRVVINELKKSYKENPDVNNPNEMLQDSSLKLLFKTNEYKNAVFHMFSDIYSEWVADGSKMTQPASLKAIASEWVESTSSIRFLLEDEYEITKSDDDYVSSRELIAYLKKRGCVESETKIGRELTGLGCNGVYKKLDGESVRVRTGLKIRGASESLGIVGS